MIRLCGRRYDESVQAYTQGGINNLFERLPEPGRGAFGFRSNIGVQDQRCSHSGMMRPEWKKSKKPEADRDHESHASEASLAIGRPRVPPRQPWDFSMAFQSAK